jgi:hypothetical protein
MKFSVNLIIHHSSKTKAIVFYKDLFSKIVVLREDIQRKFILNAPILPGDVEKRAPACEL